MSKKLQLICLAVISVFFLKAQDNPTKEYQSKVSATEVPSQEWNDWFNGEVEKFTKTAGKTAIVNHTIPVIFHIIHFGQTSGTYPNIAATQIASQINILNADYAGVGFNYTNVPQSFANLASNTGIQFCPALFDPSGAGLFEAGIHRINAVTQGWPDPSLAANITTYINTYVKPANTWPPTKYLNVWISDRQATLTVNGFATWPAGTTNAGVPTPGGTFNNDGVWVYTRKIGDIGTITVGNKGRTLTREVGHWLGLRNIWGDGNCLTDFCDDTPWAKMPNTGCPVHPAHLNRCGQGQSPNGEMTMNFMDDTDEGCKYMFTHKQTIRMQTAMSQGTYRYQLGLHSLCANPVQNPAAPVPNVSVNVVPCIGQPWTPINNTTGWPPPTYQWNSSPAASFYPVDIVPNPAITFNTPGTHTLYVTATNTVNTVTYSFVVNSVTTCPAQPLCIDTLSRIRNIDTLITYAAPTNTNGLNCTSGYMGFLTGTNCHVDKEFAQFYPASTYNNVQYPQVNSVIVLFDSRGTKATPNTAGTQIICNLYGGTVNNGPQSFLASKSDSLRKIQNSTKYNTIEYCGTPTYTFTTSRIIPFRFDFLTPVVITPASPGFFAAIQTPFSSPVDSINIFGNTKANTLPNDSSAWVLVNSTNNWRTMRNYRHAKIQLAILPIITCKPFVGIKENTSAFASNINVMPNPNNGVFSLVFTLPVEENLNVKIHNALGQEISSDDLKNVSNNVIDIDMANRPDGIYFIHVSNKKETVIRKIVITH